MDPRRLRSLDVRTEMCRDVCLCDIQDDSNHLELQAFSSDAGSQVQLSSQRWVEQHGLPKLRLGAIPVQFCMSQLLTECCEGQCAGASKAPRQGLASRGPGPKDRPGDTMQFLRFCVVVQLNFSRLGAEALLELTQTLAPFDHFSISSLGSAER